MSERFIVALGGPPGSGKTTLARYLAKEHGFEVVEADDCIIDEGIQRGVKPSSFAEYDGLFKRVQREKSFSWMAACTLEVSAERIVLAGLSTRRDARRIQQAGGATVALTCPPDICLGRVDPTKVISPTTAEEYDLRIRAELNNTDRQGLQGSRASAWAQYEIDTSSTLDVAYRTMDAVLADIPGQNLVPAGYHRILSEIQNL